MSFTLLQGTTQQLTASFLDNFGAPLFGVGVPKWSSSNPSVASVNAVGVVSGVANGTATVTATLGGVSGSSVVTVATPMVPTLEHWFVEDGNFPRVAPNGIYFYGRQGQATQYNAGGVIDRLGLAQPAGNYPAEVDLSQNQFFIAGPGGGVWTDSGNVGVAPSSSVLATQPLYYRRFTVNADPGGWSIDIRKDLIPADMGAFDNPTPISARVFVKGTAGDQYLIGIGHYNAHDFSIVPSQTVTLSATEQELDFSALYTFTAGELASGIQMSIVFTPVAHPANGHVIDIANSGIEVGEQLSAKYQLLPIHPSPYVDHPSGLAIHPKRGLRIQNNAQNHLATPGDVGQSTQWAQSGSSGWTTTDSGTLGPDGRLVPNGHVDRDWKRQVVAVGGVQVCAAITLPQDQVGQPGGDSPAGTAKNKRVRIHFYLKKDGTNALPVAGDLQFELTDSVSTKTGLLSNVLADEIDPTIVTAYAEITVDASNTATSFTPKLRNVSGHTLQFLESRRAIEREAWLSSSTRNFVPPDAMVIPQRWPVGGEGTWNGGVLIQNMVQHRTESPQLVVDLNNFTVVWRWFIPWDLNELVDVHNTGVEIWRKLCDSGPQASSFTTFLHSIHRKTSGEVGWQSNISDSPNVGGVAQTLEFPLALNTIVRNAFNDFAVIGTAGRTTDVFINGTWYSLISGTWYSIVGGVQTPLAGVVEQVTPGTIWTLGNAFFDGQDRDFDCGFNAWLRARSTKTAAAPHADVEAYFAKLNVNGVGSR